MSAADVARVPAYCRIFERMAERNIEIACILEEGLTLDEDFPELLQAPEALAGDWDILVLGRSGAGAESPRNGGRLFGRFRMASSAAAQGAVLGILIRQSAAQTVHSLALPVRAPIEQCLQEAAERGARLRFLLPAAAHPQPVREPQPAAADAEALWNDFLSAAYSPELVRLLESCDAEAAPDAVQKPPPRISLKRLFLDACMQFLRSVSLGRALKALLTRAGPARRQLRALPAPLPTAPQSAAVSGADAMKVAVIIPLFNREQLIIPVIQNLERQIRAPQRLIVVDDASTDDSARKVREYFAGKALPFAAELVLQPQNLGVSAARNLGMRHAGDCDFVYFLDADDFPPANFLQRAVSSLARAPEAAAASCDQLFESGGRRELQSNIALLDIPQLLFFFNGAGIASATLLRRRVLDRAGLFNESLVTGEDTDLFHRVADCGAWLHLPGLPAVMTRLPGQNNLSLQQNLMSWRRWTYVWEDCLYRKKWLLRVHDRPWWRGRLAYVWFRSGIELGREKRFREANECFRRSLSCRPFIIPLLHLLRGALRRERAPETAAPSIVNARSAN